MSRMSLLDQQIANMKQVFVGTVLLPHNKSHGELSVKEIIDEEERDYHPEEESENSEDEEDRGLSPSRQLFCADICTKSE